MLLVLTNVFPERKGLTILIMTMTMDSVKRAQCHPILTLSSSSWRNTCRCLRMCGLKLVIRLTTWSRIAPSGAGVVHKKGNKVSILEFVSVAFAPILKEQEHFEKR